MSTLRIETYTLPKSTLAVVMNILGSYATGCWLVPFEYWGMTAENGFTPCTAFGPKPDDKDRNFIQALAAAGKGDLGGLEVNKLSLRLSLLESIKEVRSALLHREAEVLRQHVGADNYELETRRRLLP